MTVTRLHHKDELYFYMNLPAITKKQQEILTLLYKYRFLNRIQIQTLLNHKDKKTINLWLRDLKEKHYVEWMYSTHFAEKTKPAVYHVGINGVRWLKQKTYTDEFSEKRCLYQPEEVRKRYRETYRSQAYIERCILLAGLCIGLIAKARIEPSLSYSITMRTEFLDESNEYNFLVDGDLESQLGPQLLIAQRRATASGESVGNFLVEAFDANLPRYRMSRRLKQYVTFLSEGDWEANRDDDDPLPVILIICQRLADLIYAKRRTRGLLSEMWDDDRENVHIRFATVEKLKAGDAAAWEEA